MSEIVYKVVEANEIFNDFLRLFNRHQTTEQIAFVDGFLIKHKKLRFEEEWDESKLESVSNYLKEISLKGGKVITAFHNDVVIGFANIDPNLFFNCYLNVPYIHVSYEYRGKGIGKKLFNMLCEEAVKLGAKKLYISGHPAKETQVFYKKTGCVLAKKINQKLYDIEPGDIQLEKDLSDYL
ncbi:GNAT family N-acetyltransferase [Mycoplasmatota bacterium WC30]